MIVRTYPHLKKKLKVCFTYFILFVVTLNFYVHFSLKISQGINKYKYKLTSNRGLEK